MWRIIAFGYRHAVPVLIAAGMISAAGVILLRDLAVDVSSDSLTSPANPLRETHEAVREEFGSDLVAVVYAEDPDLFTPSRLQRLRRVNESLRGLPYVQRVDSIFTLPDIRDSGGFLETAPLFERIPGSAEEARARLQAGLDNALLRRNVLAPSGTATLLTLYLDPAAIESIPLREIHAGIEAVLEPHGDAFAELFQLGKPALNTWLLDSLWDDSARILPAVCLLLFLLLSLNLRSIAAGSLPIINAAMASVWTLGLMALLGIPLNLLNYILPALILVVGATEDVHIIHEYRAARAAGKSGTEAIRETADAIGLALILTATTTILGFAATAASALPILQSFGFAAVIGMTLRFAISLLVLPAFLRILDRFMQRDREVALIPRRVAQACGDFVVRYIVPKVTTVVLILIAIALLAAYQGREIRINNDLVSFIQEDSEIHRQLDRSAEQLAGSKFLFLTTYDEDDGFLQPANLRQLQGITRFLRDHAEFDTVISFADVIARINQQLRGGAPEDLAIPDSAAAVQQMLLFANVDDFSAYISDDFARANIVIRCNINDSTRLNEIAEQIRGTLDSGRFGPQVYTLTGDALLVSSAVDSIVTAQMLSLGGMALLLFIIVSGLFLSLRCGALTVLANLFSIVVIFGVMGLTGVSLNVGTCMIAAITLGIAIDDTLHLLVRFNRELKKTKEEVPAIRSALVHELNPVVSTSLALAGGFVVLAFSSFGPVREFGVLSAGVLLLAMATDLVVTPVLFANTRIVTLWDVVGLSLRKRLLSESVIFRGFTAWQAKKLILACDIEEHPAGKQLIRTGDPGDTMYVILSGELEVSVGEGGERTVLTHLGLGEVLGEIAIVARMPRSADVTVLSDARLLTLDADTLESLRRFSPFLASRLFLNLANILGLRLVERTRQSAAAGSDSDDGAG